jgi:uroporphyrinogen-III synthase
MEQKTPGRLAGLRIAVTREEPGELAALLQAEGAEVVHCPLIRVAPVESAALSACFGRDYDWIVFTSVNAVRVLLGKEGQTPFPFRKRGLTLCVACVGDTTAAAAREAGWNVSLVPERQHVKGLIEAFAALKQTGRVLYPRSEIAPGTLKEGLQALGYEVDDPVAYRTEPNETGMKQLKTAVADGLGVLAFASPSAVRNAAAAGAASGVRTYSIGPTTSAAIRDAGMQLAGEAKTHDVASLVQAIIEGEARDG